MEEERIKTNKLPILIFILFLAFLFVSNANASVQTLFINCSAGNGCVKSGTDPLFSQINDGYWYPDMSLTKIINLKNSGTQAKEMIIKGSKVSSSDLENIMTVEILNTKTGIVVWSGSLHDFYNQNKISMGIVNPNTNTNYNFKASMDANAGNDYQGLQSVFNLTLGFWQQEPDNSAAISGFKYFDLNGNNKWDGWLRGEFKIDGWVIFLDKNNNKRLDREEDMRITSGITNFLPDGNYHFDKLIAGTYNICEVQLPGWESSLANHAVCQQVTINSGQNKTDVNFGNSFTSNKRN